MTTIPLIHINGTSASELKREVREVYEALSVVRGKLGDMTVHSRDHYPKQDKDSFNKAQAEHRARFELIDKLKMELMDLHKGIADQERERA